MELNPDWNVLIFHDQQSEIKWNYGYSTHAHYELDLPNTDGTKGYEIWLLDDADFVLHGDGGVRTIPLLHTVVKSMLIWFSV